MSTATYWCELAWLGGEAPEPSVQIDVESGRISAVAAGVAATAGATVLPGLTMPGLANSHSHAFQRALRGRTQAATHGSFWTWREQMYALAQTLQDEDLVENLARATFAEMALAGISLVGEFDYLHHSEAMLRAARDAGLRITLIDACYLDGGLPQFRDPGPEAWAERVSGISALGLARQGAAIHSVRAVDPDSARIVAAVAAEQGWPLHAHVSEQPAENQECLRKHGMTPLQLLDRIGALSPRFTAVHATHFTESDRELLEANEGFGCLCPTTERDLADGIGRVRGRLTLGSDSQSVIDLFEEARAVELDERLGTLVRGNHTAASLALGVTENGYDSLGWPEGGRIAPGALADLVSVRLDGVRLAGTRAEDALAAVVFAGTAGDVDTLVVDGEVVVSGGRHVRIDVAAELADAIASV
ncbi:MAG TPA: formimidoylglutamate deiminase [Solirubrobacteraceae bacterium]|nr:formimidoylglutamate deiminase [Solirubrobacteraceae bacterium]